MIEIVAQLNNLRMSAKKIRLVTDSIKGMDVNPAIVRLEVTAKRSAPLITKLLKSAIASAKHNHEIEAESLIVKNIIVNQAIALKRWKPAAQGAAHPFKKHGSHIRLILTAKPGAKLPQDKKSDVKAQASKIEKETVKVDKLTKSGSVKTAGQNYLSDRIKSGHASTKSEAKKSITRTTSK